MAEDFELTQDELDDLPVMSVTGQIAVKQSHSASEWLAEPVLIGRKLTAEELAEFTAADGYEIDNDVDESLHAVIVKRVDGWFLIVKKR